MNSLRWKDVDGKWGLVDKKTDLRKAAEELIEAWDWDCSEPRNKVLRDLIEDLRQALAMENFSEVNQEIEEALKEKNA